MVSCCSEDSGRGGETERLLLGCPASEIKDSCTTNTIESSLSLPSYTFHAHPNPSRQGLVHPHEYRLTLFLQKPSRSSPCSLPRREAVASSQQLAQFSRPPKPSRDSCSLQVLICHSSCSFSICFTVLSYCKVTLSFSRVSIYSFRIYRHLFAATRLRSRNSFLLASFTSAGTVLRFHPRFQGPSIAGCLWSSSRSCISDADGVIRLFASKKSLLWTGPTVRFEGDMESSCCG